MEKIAGDMSGLLQETLDLYQDLKSVLVTEKSHIEKMEVQNLWATTEKKKRLVQSIEDKVAKILEQLNGRTASFDMTVQNFKIREVIAALPLKIEVKSKLKTLANRIDACKKEITLMAYENKRFIVEYLSVIDGIFNTVRQGTGQKQYSQTGQVYASGENTRIINAEV
jgi:flagellar biosynthesis/type III secretory pathway chaperone